MARKRGGGVVGIVEGRKEERERGPQKARVSRGGRKAGVIARFRALQPGRMETGMRRECAWKVSRAKGPEEAIWRRGGHPCWVAVSAPGLKTQPKSTVRFSRTLQALLSERKNRSFVLEGRCND